MSRDAFDYCILGAGIAGLSLADALQEQGHSVCVIDKSEVAAGASGTPGGLVNPATGRRGTKTWKAEACYSAIKENLEKVSEFVDEPIYRQNGVLRPALLEKMARKMREQYEKTTWDDGWCQWKTEEEIKAIHPGIQCVDGGLWLPPGLTVNIGAYLRALATYLNEVGVEIITHAETAIEKASSNWKVHASEQTIISSDLIFATGYETIDSPYWDDLPLHPIKGQVGLFEVPKDLLNFDHSISSLGYIARLDGSNRFIQGSTYDHDFDDLEPNEEGLEYLRGRMKRTLPQLEEKAVLIEQWAGVRASTPNYKPILGRHPNHKNLHVFTGLGSKGLMYGKFLANHYIEHLKDRKPLYPSIDIGRF
ncbi:MAG: FAD-dependent oxidoreductase [Balneolaceae bacterium]|nr:FAD-dependent oxidoreductase [Balneolaceae bacterium]